MKKSEIARGTTLNFKRFNSERNNLIGTAHGRFKWTIEKAPFGKQTARGWKGYIVKMRGQEAFKCNWLRDFKPAVRHLEQTYSGDDTEFYDTCKTGDIWSLNTRLFSVDTISLLETAIITPKKPIIPRVKKESKLNRNLRLARAKALLETNKG